ncbi:8149_t:CDS:2 [Gigaspora margarita]|uniref:8149_t:CDS:1 n=1 Tax=Gigaspora margarita TaxID=4874 RepID=A0ABN7UX99_GIGMA|nr:8149_t:CDS:2 [Gigaspora margarita]
MAATKLVTKTLAPKPLSSETLIPETFSPAIRPLTDEIMSPAIPIRPLTNETLSPVIRPLTDPTNNLSPQQQPYFATQSSQQQPYSATQFYMNSYETATRYNETVK